jgi:hypothetical protein
MTLDPNHSSLKLASIAKAFVGAIVKHSAAAAAWSAREGVAEASRVPA